MQISYEVKYESWKTYMGKEFTKIETEHFANIKDAIEFITEAQYDTDKYASVISLNKITTHKDTLSIPQMIQIYSEKKESVL